MKVKLAEDVRKKYHILFILKQNAFTFNNCSVHNTVEDRAEEDKDGMEDKDNDDNNDETDGNISDGEDKEDYFYNHNDCKWQL